MMLAETILICTMCVQQTRLPVKTPSNPYPSAIDHQSAISAAADKAEASRRENDAIKRAAKKETKARAAWLFSGGVNAAKLLDENNKDSKKPDPQTVKMLCFQFYKSTLPKNEQKSAVLSGAELKIMVNGFNKEFGRKK